MKIFILKIFLIRVNFIRILTFFNIFIISLM
nr:MAG TPA: hypothetical protein [Bacteriophage sp.]